MMKKRTVKWFVFFLLLFLFAGFLHTVSAVSGSGRLIFDEAGLLTETEKEELEELASELGGDRETEFLIITADSMDGKDIDRFTSEFIDRHYKDQASVVVLALDMETRDVSVLAFNEAQRKFDNLKREFVLEEVIPYLSAGEFYKAFSKYLQTSYELMGIPPGEWEETGKASFPGSAAVPEEPSESIFTRWWFHVIVSLVVAGVTVGLMAYNSGGRVTVNAATYLNAGTSKVINQSDHYLRKTVTKRRKPQHKSGGPSGFGGGGGMTSGGHTFSSTRGKF